jgi:hypothetical protein
MLIAACADGAGSAELAEVGARLAVEAFIANAKAALLKENFNPADLDQRSLSAWNMEARRRIEEEAQERGVPLRQMACTLLTAIVGPWSAAFSQIGDGVIIFVGPEGYEYVFWPDSGEYANTTRFLTDADFAERIRFDYLPRPISDVAILTDGLQMLALNYVESKVHDPFFKPMFEALRSAPQGESLKPALEAFLDSERVNQRTDDDKTLLLGTRRITLDHVPSDNHSQTT